MASQPAGILAGLQIQRVGHRAAGRAVMLRDVSWREALEAAHSVLRHIAAVWSSGARQPTIPGRIIQAAAPTWRAGKYGRLLFLAAFLSAVRRAGRGGATGVGS